MTQSYTAKQIAAAMSVADRTIRIRAAKEEWPSTKIAGKGGLTSHFSLTDLPDDVQMKVNQYYQDNQPTDPVVLAASNSVKKMTGAGVIDNSISLNRKQSALVEIAGVNGTNSDRAEAIYSILKAAIQFIKKSDKQKVAALKDFCEQYNNQCLGLDKQIYHLKPTVGFSTLLRWESNFSKHGMKAFIAQYGNKKGSGVIEATPEMKSFCLALLKEYPHIKASQVVDALAANFSGQFKIPSEKSCRDWLKQWKSDNQELFMSLIDPSGWQNKRMVAFGNKSAGINRINQLWEFDSTPADVMLTDGRYSIVGVIDVFTRRVKLILRPTSNSEAISLLIRETILDWGLPEVARTDNGSDYTSVHISSVWDALGIEHEITTPYSGWEKPFIERFFRTFSHGIAELCQGYIGHNVQDRQKINARLTFEQRLIERRKKGEEKIALNVSLSAEEFEKFINQWINAHYHHEKHSALECSPFQKFANHQQQIKRLDNEHVLDVLLAPVPGNKGFRTVTKSDGISVEGGSYVDAELGAYIGERVYCRWNPKDIGKIFVFHALKHHFICEAINHEVAEQGISLQEVAIKAKHIQRQQQRERRAEFKKATAKHNVTDIAHQILAHKVKTNGSLVALPKPSNQSNNATANAIKQAITISEKPSYTEKQLSEFEMRRQQITELEKTKTPVFTSDAHKARFLTELSINTELPAIEKSWLHDFRRRNKAASRVLDEILNSKKATQ
jgi:hypothetical protein